MGIHTSAHIVRVRACLKKSGVGEWEGGSGLEPCNRWLSARLFR